MYISQDPIGLEGGLELYSYVNNLNSEIDCWGLVKSKNQAQGDAGRDALTKRLENSSRYEVIGNEVRINTPENGSYRKVDILVRDRKTKEIIAIEVKTGGAKRNNSQLSKDAEIAVGRNTTWGTKKVENGGLKKYGKTGPIRTIEVTVDEKTGKIKKSC
jgi:uncharacterized protein RhaS with RHS repeats